MAADDVELASAIARNVYRKDAADGSARTLALYARLARIHLCSASIVDGAAEFGPLPGSAQEGPA